MLKGSEEEVETMEECKTLDSTQGRERDTKVTVYFCFFHQSLSSLGLGNLYCVLYVKGLACDEQLCFRLRC